MFEYIQGRADDIFWAKRIGTDEWQYIFPDYISRAIITASEEIDEFQVVQSSPDQILIRIQLKEGLSRDQFAGESEVRKNILNIFDSYNCKSPVLSIVYEKPEFNRNSNKLVRIQRTFKIE